MTTEPEKHELEWRQMRHKTMGELLHLKFTGSDYTRELVQMELDRRTFAADRAFDRRVTLLALVISILALSATLWRTAQEVMQSRSKAGTPISTPHSPGLPDPAAKTP